MTPISRTEEMLLLTVCRLQDEAYAMQIREVIKELTGKLYSIGGIYVPLDRLTHKGLLRMLDENPIEERMGRPRRKFIITEEGLNALRLTRHLEDAMWNLPPSVLQKIKLV